MSLYGNFTLKEWLTLHCASEDIDNLFRKALKDNDEPMAVLALAELIKRGDTDLVTYAINDAIKEEHIAVGTHFSSVFANALLQIGSRDPLIKGYGRYFISHKTWPKSAEELLRGTSFAEIIKHS